MRSAARWTGPGRPPRAGRPPVKGEEVLPVKTLRWFLLGLVAGVVLRELKLATGLPTPTWAILLLVLALGLVELKVWVRRKDPGAKKIDREPGP